jgi:hypothetical protein
MSDNISDNEDNQTSGYEVQVKLTTYTLVTKTSKKALSTKTFKKDSKLKSKDFDYTFEDSAANYTKFLNALLELVGLNYQASETCRFHITVTVQEPPATYVIFLSFRISG